jgi:cellulose synthase/poly-beta-1,6-N-acetylglucosamine synthase-like glycosyltransferase
MALWFFYGAGFCVGAVVLALHLALGIGAARNRIRDLRLVAAWPEGRPESGPRLPRATVIVVAKDEEAVLPALLASLEAQTMGDFEIVLIDDRSTDGTGTIMESFRRASKRPVKVLANRHEPEGVTGKVQALDIAVAHSAGELLVFTDSDCVLPATWVAAHLAYYRDSDVGVVFGPITMPPSAKFLEAYQAFDQRLIHQYSSGSAGIGFPTGCFGNNLSARRAAVESVGGFRGLGYTITEDAALIAAIGKRRRWRVLASTLSELTISTRPQGSWRDFLNQHTRWNIGGFYSTDFATRAPYRLLVLYLTSSVLAAPLGAAAPLLLVLALNALLSIGILAVLDATLYPGRTPRDRLVLLPYTLFFMVFYALVTVRAILRRRPEWKGSRLEVRP